MYLFNIRYHKTIKNRFNAKWLSGGCGGLRMLWRFANVMGVCECCGEFRSCGSFGGFGVVENYKDYERLTEGTKIM